MTQRNPSQFNLADLKGSSSLNEFGKTQQQSNLYRKRIYSGNAHMTQNVNLMQETALSDDVYN